MCTFVIFKLSYKHHDFHLHQKESDTTLQQKNVSHLFKAEADLLQCNTSPRWRGKVQTLAEICCGIWVYPPVVDKCWAFHRNDHTHSFLAHEQLINKGYFVWNVCTYPHFFPQLHICELAWATAGRFIMLLLSMSSPMRPSFLSIKSHTWQTCYGWRW